MGGGGGVHIASMGERRGVYRALVGWGNLKSTTVLGAIIFLTRSYTNQTTELP